MPPNSLENECIQRLEETRLELEAAKTRISALEKAIIRARDNLRETAADAQRLVNKIGTIRNDLWSTVE